MCSLFVGSSEPVTPGVTTALQLFTSAQQPKFVVDVPLKALHRPLDASVPTLVLETSKVSRRTFLNHSTSVCRHIQAGDPRVSTSSILVGSGSDADFMRITTSATSTTAPLAKPLAHLAFHTTPYANVSPPVVNALFVFIWEFDVDFKQHVCAQERACHVHGYQTTAVSQRAHSFRTDQPSRASTSSRLS